jgi:hypothetical protein
MPVEYLTPRSRTERWTCSPCSLTAASTARRPHLDLIIAATAELAGLTVLHLDQDFEVIAQVTGQPVERPSTGQ